MANTGWKIGKKVELNNSLQIATYRQIVNKETSFHKAKTQKDIKEKQAKMESKNTYMHLFKTDDTKKKETKIEKSTT